jgi:hypothetical protein
MSLQGLGPAVLLVVTHLLALGAGFAIAVRRLSKKSLAADWKSLANDNPQVVEFLRRLSAEDDMLARSIKRVAEHVSDPGERATRIGNMLDDFNGRHRVLMDCYLPLPAKGGATEQGDIFRALPTGAIHEREGGSKGLVPDRFNAFNSERGAAVS